MSSAPPPSAAHPPDWAAPPGRQPEGPRGPGDAHGDTHGEGHANAHEHNRLALVLALSIALVSVLGAVVGWRAETHASKASRYSLDAVSASIVASQLRSQAEAIASAAQNNYEHYTRLGEEAQRLAATSCPVTSTSNLIELDAQAACSMQQVFAGYDDPDYVKDGSFDVTAYADDVQKVLSYDSDSDPARYEQLATSERHHEDNMLYLSLGLVLALALLTLARLGKATSSRLVLAIPGWLALAGGAALLAYLEL